jgi:hypothetical protein
MIAGNRNKFQVLASLSWRPFEARFQDFLDQLLLHREVIEKELQLATYVNSLKAENVLAEQLLLTDKERKLLIETKARLEMVSDVQQEKYKGKF